MTERDPSTTTESPPPYNRLRIDYRRVPRRKIAGAMIDAHTHAHNVELTRQFLIAANAYDIGGIWTMAPLEDVDALRSAFPGRFEFIAVPQWRNMNSTAEFINDWRRRLDVFFEKGSRLVKFHMAPGTQKRTGLTLDHPEVRRVIRHAYQLGYHFMTHVGDPRAWFGPGKKYDPRDGYKTFEEQFPILERLLEEFPDRAHLGAHMGGSMEDLDNLQRRLDRFAHYFIDCSATKWIVRSVARQPLEKVRAFIIRNQDRIVFGSDLVVGDKYNFDHYASRYWVHQKLWETDYQGESPIADPDAPGGSPKLTGLDLPAEVLEKLYRSNARRWLYERVLGRT